MNYTRTENTNTQALLNQSRECANSGNTNRALELLTVVISNEPQSIEACVLLGKIMFNEKQYDQADGF